MRKDKQEGFTIVELLIVIVVIGILAAITIATYNGIQARANDSKTASAANNIEKAIKLFNINTGLQPYSGSGTTTAMPASPDGSEACPSATTLGGWAGKGTYVCTLEDLLVAYKLISPSLFSSLPPNAIAGKTPSHTFMLYKCGSNAKGYILMWYLASSDAATTSRFRNEYNTCTGSTAYDITASTYYTSYGMRDGRFIQLN